MGPPIVTVVALVGTLVGPMKFSMGPLVFGRRGCVWCALVRLEAIRPTEMARITLSASTTASERLREDLLMLENGSVIPPNCPPSAPKRSVRGMGGSGSCGSRCGYPRQADSSSSMSTTIAIFGSCQNARMQVCPYSTWSGSGRPLSSSSCRKLRSAPIFCSIDATTSRIAEGHETDQDSFVTSLLKTDLVPPTQGKTEPASPLLR